MGHRELSSNGFSVVSLRSAALDHTPTKEPLPGLTTPLASKKSGNYFAFSTRSRRECHGRESISDAYSEILSNQREKVASARMGVPSGLDSRSTGNSTEIALYKPSRQQKAASTTNKPT